MPVLRRRLGLGLGALLVAGVSAMAALEWRSYQAELADQHSLLARVLADHATRTLDGAAQASAQLAFDIERETNASPQHLTQLLQQAMAYQPALRGLVLLQADGTILASTNPSEAGRRIQILQLLKGERRDQVWLGTPLPVRTVADLVDPIRRAPRGVSVLPLMKNVSRGAGPGLLLVAQINPETFALFQKQITAGMSAAGTMLTLEGAPIVGLGRDRDPPASVLTLAPFKDFLPDREWGAWQGESLLGKDQIASFRMTPRWPVLVTAETSRADARADWWVSTRVEIIAIASVGALLLAVALVAARVQSARQRALAQRDAARAAIHERDETLAVLVDSLQETVFRTDAQGTLAFISDQVERLVGEPASALLGRPLWSLVTSSQQYQVQALFALPTTGDARTALVQFQERGDHTAPHVELSLRALVRDGEVIGFAGSAADVSARVLAQRSLETQLNFLQQVFEVSPMPTSVFDVNRRYEYVNAAWEAFVGRSRYDVLGTRVGANLNDEQRSLHEAMDQELLGTGQPLRYHATVRRADGALRDVFVFKLLLPGGPSQPTRILAKMLDVTEMRDAERAMQEARDAAEDASRAKSEFIANISHELRTPLQSIVGFSEIGEMRSAEQPRLRVMFEDIHAAGQRMLALVNDLLDVAKLDSAIGAIHFERTELRELVGAIGHEMQPLLAKKQLELALRLPDYPVFLQADPLRIQQVIRNLLANAIKFSPTTGCITLGMAQADGKVLVSVADQGPGVPESELEGIFDAFTQSSRTKDGSGGTGLGLTISRKIAQAHGGRLWAENRPEGGAMFHLELAERPADGPATEPAPLS